MSRHDDQVRLRHMLDHAEEAIELTRGKVREDLEKERLLQLGLVRLVEIVGEAAVKVTKDTQRRHPEVPWPQIVAMRNRLIHGYDLVDHDILWQTIQEDLPALIEKLRKILGSDQLTE
jgi:uncharacterized protein with HEPN domain